MYKRQALDLAIDREAAQIKKVHSLVAGDADCLVFNISLLDSLNNLSI